MPETFLTLLAGGIMLSAALPVGRQVTVHWLRLCGILALSLAGLGALFALRRAPLPVASETYRWIQRGQLIALIVLILAHVGFVQMLFIRTQRLLAAAAFLVAVMAATGLLHEIGARAALAKPQAVALQALACAGVGALTGLALMDMLLGHAYLTAARMTIAPFRRLNLALGWALGLRMALGVVAVALQQAALRVELFWPRFALMLATRWLVGFIVPAVFVYMAHDCIRRRSTQSATGILYVAAVLIFIGELIALYLTRETGLPL